MPSAPDRSPPRGSYRRRVAPPRDRKGSEYANFDCQERVNAGQKVVQLGHATGTNIIPRVSPAAGRYHPGAASRYAVIFARWFEPVDDAICAIPATTAFAGHLV